MRHAQSQSNANSKLTPEQRINSRLTVKGITQSKSLEFEFDLIILTPLKRSLETYINSGIKARTVVIMDIFREFKNDPVNFMESEEMKYETKEMLKIRVDKSIAILKELASSHESIGVISHYGFLKYLTGKMVGKRMIFDNCQFLDVEV
jgi:broad specificity phosphatase PhoE